MLRRSLPLNLIEKCELRARHMLHLFPKRSHSLEISLTRNVRVLLLGHRFRNAKKSLLRPTQRAPNASRYTLRNLLLLRRSLRRDKNQPCENDESGELHSYLLLKDNSDSDLSFA